MHGITLARWHVYQHARMMKLPLWHSKLTSGGHASIELPTQNMSLSLMELRLPVTTTKGHSSKNEDFRVPSGVSPTIAAAFASHPDVVVLQFGLHVIKRPGVLQETTSIKVPSQQISLLCDMTQPYRRAKNYESRMARSLEPSWNTWCRWSQRV